MRDRSFNLLIFLTIALFALSSKVRADWVYANFSDRAKIDSIERAQVLLDWETGRPYAWWIVPIGDINQDGSADILVTVNMSDPFVVNPAYLYYGGKSTDTVFSADKSFTEFSPIVNQIGDVNADGFVDLLQYDIYPYRMDFFWGGPDLDDIPDFSIPNHFSLTDQKVCDLDGDGHIDLPLSVSANGGDVHIFRIDNQRDTIPEHVIADTATSFGRRLQTMDINGDNYDDLLVACYWNRDTNIIKIYFGGPEFDTIADYIMKNPSPSFGILMVPIGDFNADGYSDLFIAGGGNDPYGVYFGGPEFDGDLDVIVNRSSRSVLVPPNSATYLGDFNSDGYDDFAFGYINGFLYIFEVYIFLGGPDIRKGERSADIYIEEDMVPGSQYDFGRTTVGIGDFTGDGIPDLATNGHESILYGGHGAVQVFAGYNPNPTYVTIESEPTLPESYILHQNYPNPFNPSTTIEFELPVGQHVTLEVFNVLGQRVETLVDRFMSAGLHKVVWDAQVKRNHESPNYRSSDLLGTGEGGSNSLPTGVYLYRLKGEGIDGTKKMVLVK